MFATTLRYATRSALTKGGPSSSHTAAAAFSTNAAGMKNVVIVDGTRLPFATTTTTYMDELAVDLQRLAISGLLTKTALPKDAVDYV